MPGLICEKRNAPCAFVCLVPRGLRLDLDRGHSGGGNDSSTTVGHYARKERWMFRSAPTDQGPEVSTQSVGEERGTPETNHSSRLANK